MFPNQKAKANGEERAVMADLSSISLGNGNAPAPVKGALGEPINFRETKSWGVLAPSNQAYVGALHRSEYRGRLEQTLRRLSTTPRSEREDDSDDSVSSEEVLLESIGDKVRTRRMLMRFDRDMFSDFLKHPQRYELKTKNRFAMDNTTVFHGVAATRKDGALFGVTSLVEVATGSFCLLKGEYAVNAVFLASMIRGLVNRGVVSLREFTECFSEGKVTYKLVRSAPGIFCRGWRAEEVPGFVSHTISGLVDGESIEQVGFVVGLVHAIVTKNKVQVACYLAQRARLLSGLCAAFMVDGIDGLIDYFERVMPQKGLRYQFKSEETNQIYSFATDDAELEQEVLAYAATHGNDAAFKKYGPRMSCELETEEQVTIAGEIVEELSELPGLIVSTKWMQNLSLLAGMAASSVFFSETMADMPRLRQVLSWVDPRSLVATAGVTALVIGTIKLLFSAFKRVRDTGNLMAMFGLDEEVAFRLKADEFISSDFFDKTESHVVQAVAEMKKVLIPWMKKKYPSREVTMAIIAVKAKILELTKRLESEAPRVEPCFVWLAGEPGAGKTIAASNMLTYAAKIDGRERFPGDSAILEYSTAYLGENLPSNDVIYLGMNDIPADSSGAAKDGRVAIDVLCQKVLDTAPLTLQHPVAEEKGKKLTKVNLFYLSSNQTTHLGEQDTDKLVRRMNEGFLCRFFFDNSRLLAHTGGTTEVHKARARKDMAILNTVVVIVKQEAVSSGRHITLKDTDVRFYLHDFQHFFSEWYTRDRVRVIRKYEMLQQTCTLGFCLSSHFYMTSTTPSVRAYKPCGEGCCDPATLIDVPREDGEETIAGEARRERGLWHTIAAISVAVSSVLLSVTGGIFVGTATMFFVSIVGAERASKFIDYTRATMVALTMNFLTLVPLSVRLNFPFLEKQRQSFVLYSKIVRFQDAVKAGWWQHRSTIAAILGVGALAYLINYFSKEGEVKDGVKLESAGGAFSHMREIVPPENVPIISVAREMSYPPSTIDKWKKKPVPMPMGTLSFVKQNCNAEDILSAIKRQLFSAELSWKDSSSIRVVRKVLVTFWNADYISVPTHSLYDESDGNWWSDEFKLKVALPTGEVTKTFRNSEVHRRRDCDVALLRNTFPFKTMVPLDSFLVDSVDSPILSGLFHVFSSGQRYEGTLTATLMFTDPYRNLPLRMFAFPMDVAVSGDCGSPLVVFAGTKGCAGIGGVISARGAARLTGFTQFTLRDYNNLLAVNPLQTIAGELVVGLPAISSHNFENGISALGPLSPNSVLREVVRTGILPLGTLPIGSATFKSRLTETPMRKRVEASGVFTELYVPPKSLKSVYDGEYYSAFANMYASKTENSAPLSEWLVATSAYFERVKPLAARAKLAPLTFAQAMFGDPELGFDAVNGNASNGGTLSDLGMRNKIDLFTKTDFRPEFIERFESFKERINSRFLPAVKCHAVPKDELRPVSKVVLAKIRLFMVMDFHVNLLTRAYLLPLFKLLLDHPFTSGIFAKINAASPQWDALARWLRAHAHGDGDFSKFDVAHAYEAFLCFAVFMRGFALECSYTVEEADAVYKLCLVLSLQVVVYQSDVFLKTDGLPSGWLGTLMFNCVINVVLHMMAWRRLTGRSFKDFFSVVRLGVVGDDNVWSLQTPEPRWTIPALVSTFGELGYPATSGSKTAAFADYVAFEDLGFLKRKFVLDGGVYYGPLATDSLWKAICWEERKAHVVPLQRMVGVVMSFQREAYLHGSAGRSMVEALKIIFEEVYQIPFPVLPWEDLTREYQEGMITYWSVASGGLIQVPPNKDLDCLETVNHSPVGYASSSSPGEARSDPADGEPAVLMTISGEMIRSPGKENCIAENQSLNNPGTAAPSVALAQNATSVAHDDQGEGGEYSVRVSEIGNEYPGFVHQPIQFVHTLWTGATASGGILWITPDIITTYFSAIAGTPLAGRISNFFRFTADVRIRLVIQGSPQLAGKVILYADPGKTHLSSGDVTVTHRVASAGLVNSFVLPHIEVDPAVSQSYELVLPLVTQCGFYTTKANTGSWRLLAQVVNPLRTGTASTATVSICGYVSLENVRADGMTTIAGVIVNGVAENSGKLSGLAHGISKISKYAGSVFPVLSPIANVVSVVGGKIGDILHFLGFAKPSISQVTLPMLTRTTDAYSHSVGVSTAMVLGSSQEHTLGVDPTFGGGDLREMDLRYLCSIKAPFVLDATIAPALAAFTLIESYPINPMLSLPGTPWPPSPLGGCSLPFEYWHGDITLDFEFVASVFQRATVLIAWDPAAVAHVPSPSFDACLSSLQNTTVQISGHTRVSIEIPWKSLRSYALVGDLPLYAGNPSPLETCNGRVWLWLVNPVVSNGGADPIGMNIYVSSSSIMLAAPTQHKLPASGNYVMETIAGKITKVKFGEDSSVSEQIVARSLGDVSMGVKDVTSRHSHAFRADDLLGAGQDFSNVAIRFMNYPTFPNPIVNMVSPIFVSTWPFGPSTGAITTLAWFANAYNSMRGSLSWSTSIKVGTGNVGAPAWPDTIGILEHHVKPAGFVPNQVIQVGAVSANTPTVSNVGECYSYAIVQTGTTGRVDGVAPMMVPYPLVPTGAIFSNYGSFLRLRPAFAPAQSGGLRCDATVGSGDDMVFVFFKGFPFITL